MWIHMFTLSYRNVLYTTTYEHTYMLHTCYMNIRVTYMFMNIHVTYVLHTCYMIMHVNRHVWHVWTCSWAHSSLSVASQAACLWGADITEALSSWRRSPGKSNHMCSVHTVWTRVCVVTHTLINLLGDSLCWPVSFQTLHRKCLFLMTRA